MLLRQLTCSSPRLDAPSPQNLTGLLLQGYKHWNTIGRLYYTLTYLTHPLLHLTAQDSASIRPQLSTHFLGKNAGSNQSSARANAGPSEGNYHPLFPSNSLTPVLTCRRTTHNACAINCFSCFHKLVKTLVVYCTLFKHSRSSWQLIKICSKSWPFTISSRILTYQGYRCLRALASIPLQKTLLYPLLHPLLSCLLTSQLAQRLGSVEPFLAKAFQRLDG